MEVLRPLPESVIFRNPSVNHFGRFVLEKSMFIDAGVNVPYSYRCDNLTYSITNVCDQTAYHDEGIYLGETSPYTGVYFDPASVGMFTRIIDATPDFAIVLLGTTEKHVDGSTYASNTLLDADFPGSVWLGTSLVELLKNMREWTFMLDEPFNSEHPMAIYSKMAFDAMSTPQDVFDELDSLPDMHLARYLKGDPNHRSRLSNYPNMSVAMKNWFIEQMTLFPAKTTNQRLAELVIYR